VLIQKGVKKKLKLELKQMLNELKKSSLDFLKYIAWRYIYYIH